MRSTDQQRIDREISLTRASAGGEPQANRREERAQSRARVAERRTRRPSCATPIQYLRCHWLSRTTLSRES
jgi:hypothetical protein